MNVVKQTSFKDCMWALCHCVYNSISPLNDPMTLLPSKDETSYEEVCVRQKINIVSNL